MQTTATVANRKLRPQVSELCVNLCLLLLVARLAQFLAGLLLRLALSLFGGCHLRLHVGGRSPEHGAAQVRHHSVDRDRGLLGHVGQQASVPTRIDFEMSASADSV